MPIYEYECENKHRFEKWQSMKDDAIKECPECGTAVRRILHPAGIIFKGSGWYITDSRKSGGDEGGESKSKSVTKSSEPKSDTKSESKAESTGTTESPSTSTASGKSDAKPSPST